MRYTLLLIFSHIILISCKSNQEKKGQQEPNGQRPSSAQIISEMDKNEDGKLSRDEVIGPIANDFKNIDSNDDGFLNLEELNKAEKSQRNRPPRQTNTNTDLSNEIDTTVKANPVNTDYFITENIIGGIQEQIVELNGIEILCLSLIHI